MPVETQAVVLRRLMADYGVDAAPLEDSLVRLEKEAKTAMLLAEDGRLAGVVAVADTLKEESTIAIRELQRIGIQTAMITGDNQRTAEAIARKVSIDHILAEIAMATSSVTVVGNANRLRNVDIRPTYLRETGSTSRSEGHARNVEAVALEH